MTTHERTTTAMGTTVRVVVVDGPADLADAALRRIDDLEARWSRFLPTSELSMLNAAGGAPCIVSAETFTLVDSLVRAWHDTSGRFDPTVHDTLVDLGYSVPWPHLTPATAPGTGHRDGTPPPGCAGIDLDPTTGLVWMPEGVRLDPGGLGKGLAADVVAREVVDAGAAGVLVDLGGDVRVVGQSPQGGPWRIGVEHPASPDDSVAVVETIDGGVATTSRRRRTWEVDGAAVHHVIDPRSARSAHVSHMSATALAATACDAEVGATIAFLDGELGPRSIAALLVDADGSTRPIGRHADLFRTTAPV